MESYTYDKHGKPIFHRVARELGQPLPGQELFNDTEESSLDKPRLCTKQSVHIAFISLFPELADR